ncbi:uncharacterized protein [Henckelia pumila]|uniref:uncharacterized protein n=1 Tax=Henckelia pumila TaxID=405737 RepID=UPI003C6E76D6
MSSPASPNPSSYSDLLKQVRSHEVALAELNNLSSSRAVYHKNGNIFFRTSIEKATALEQTQLDTAKARLQKLGSS